MNTKDLRTFTLRAPEQAMFAVLPGLTDDMAEGFRVCAADFLRNAALDAMAGDGQMAPPVVWAVQFIAEALEAIEHTCADTRTALAKAR
ncbi:hypothetical protein [Luteimonas sp. e5]